MKGLQCSIACVSGVLLTTQLAAETVTSIPIPALPGLFEEAAPPDQRAIDARYRLIDLRRKIGPEIAIGVGYTSSQNQERRSANVRARIRLNDIVSEPWSEDWELFAWHRRGDDRLDRRIANSATISPTGFNAVWQGINIFTPSNDQTASISNASGALSLDEQWTDTRAGLIWNFADHWRSWGWASIDHQNTSLRWGAGGGIEWKPNDWFTAVFDGWWNQQWNDDLITHAYDGRESGLRLRTSLSITERFTVSLSGNVKRLRLDGKGGTPAVQAGRAVQSGLRFEYRILQGPRLLQQSWLSDDPVFLQGGRQGLSLYAETLWSDFDQFDRFTVVTSITDLSVIERSRAWWAGISMNDYIGSTWSYHVDMRIGGDHARVIQPGQLYAIKGKLSWSPTDSFYANLEAEYSSESLSAIDSGSSVTIGLNCHFGF